MAKNVAKKSKSCVMKCVLAGKRTHFQVDGRILCGCTDRVTGSYTPRMNKSSAIVYLLPVCQDCKRVNYKRWEATK